MTYPSPKALDNGLSVYMHSATTLPQDRVLLIARALNLIDLQPLLEENERLKQELAEFKKEVTF